MYVHFVTFSRALCYLSIVSTFDVNGTCITEIDAETVIWLIIVIDNRALTGHQVCFPRI